MILSQCQIGAKLSNLMIPACLITEKITYLILSQRSEEITYNILLYELRETDPEFQFSHKES